MLYEVIDYRIFRIYQVKEECQLEKFAIFFTKI
jgi:hypothetical protein